jgi:hypothetical protein
MVVKPLLDQYYSNYNLIGHIAMWDPDTWPGVHCQGVNTWYNSNANGHCGDNTNAINALHNLFTHAFAWYWRVSGDDTYRTEGDEVFAHAFDAHYNDKGKTFSQLFRYSFNYVGWRQGWLSPEQAIQ